MIPFSAILGSNPSYGMIPKNDNSVKFIDILIDISVSPIKDKVIYFNNFQEYKDYVFANKEVNDMFYCSELEYSSDTQENSIRISSNGMTVGSLPFLVQDLCATFINYSSDSSLNHPQIFLNYKKYPHSSIFKSDHDTGLNVAIFGTVHSLACILTTATYYGTEAESGLRDLFTFVGLSFFINEIRWYIISVVIIFIVSIPCIIALTIIIKINFFLILIFYILVSTSYTSYLLFLMSLWPTHQMGNVVTYVILFSLFICIFWGFFDWLYKDSGYTQKYFFSIFPNVAMSFTLAQIGAGSVTKFNQMNGPSCYPVKNGFIYLSVETIVYFILYIFIETFKKRLWLPAPIKWGKPLKKTGIENTSEMNVINVENVTKKYKENTALNNVSFSVNQGERLAIVGPNGAGKSTLMSLLSGTLNLDDGNIFFKGIDIMKNSKKIHQVAGLCPQKNIFMNELTLDEWLKTICILRNNPDFDYEDILMSLGLEEQRNYRLGKMSGGNQRKACLAAALVCHPPIVILEEATSGVDFTSRTRIWSIISGLDRTTVIMATHTLEDCEKIADRIMVIFDGEIAYLETPNDLRQAFNCGYTIITDKENLDAFENIINEVGIDNSIKIEDEKAELSISADNSMILSSILKKISFKYILSIQSLEESIFDNIHKHEMIRSSENINEYSLSGSEDLTVIHPSI